MIPRSNGVGGELRVSTDRSRIDQNAALALLRTTFWAAGMEPGILARGIINSVCFGVYDRELLVGFGIVVVMVFLAAAMARGYGISS